MCGAQRVSFGGCRALRYREPCKAPPVVIFGKLKKPFNVLPVIGLLALAACAAAPPEAIADPLESANRGVHGFNKGLDRAVIRPVARVTAPIFKSPIGTGVENLANTLSAPADVANNLLQGRVENAVHNSWRFAVNATLGLGGLFDPATKMGLDRRSTDFGETLHVWGAGEGPYVELPVFGPSTGRDAVGRVVDMVLDPVGQAVPALEGRWVTGVHLTSKLGDRARFGDTVDSILYESADSYAQARLLYLQSRRHELGQEAADDEFIDPYEDIGGN